MSNATTDLSNHFYAPYSCMDNVGQEVAHAILPKLSSSISIMGSSHILSLVYKKWKHDRSRIDPYQRIMAMHSIFDILFSFFYWFLGSWMTPKDTGWYGAVGNTATCTMQGFFSVMVYGTAMYQFTLSLQMLLLITFMWTPSQFEMMIEKKLHCFNIISTLLIATLPVFFNGYNPKCGMCDPVPLPFGCGNWILGGSTTTTDATACIRGSDTLANIYLFLFLVVISLMTVFCSGAMLSIYLSVYLQERKMVQYRFSSEEGEDEDGEEDYPESKRIRQSMILYTSSFYICWILPLVLWYAPHGVPSLSVVGDVLFSLMGFFNMIIYIHSKCVKYQQEHPGTSLFKCYIYIIFNNQLKFVQSFKRQPATTDENQLEIIIPTTNETCQFNNESEVLELPNRHRSTAMIDDETSPMSFHDEGDQTSTRASPMANTGADGLVPGDDVDAAEDASYASTASRTRVFSGGSHSKLAMASLNEGDTESEVEQSVIRQQCNQSQVSSASSYDSSYARFLAFLKTPSIPTPSNGHGCALSPGGWPLINNWWNDQGHDNTNDTLDASTAGSPTGSPRMLS